MSFHSIQLSLKDGFDRMTALFLLVATSPVWLGAMLLIRWNSPGPLFFTQQRIGLHEQPFQIIKFRTMHIAAETHDFGSVTVADDPRLFFGARALRKWKIDELPQLLNVVTGTMSLVGPRPTVREDVDRMTEWQRQRHRVKPGLTGLAQIRGAAALPWPLRIEHDIDYIRRHSLWLDLRILVQTAWLVGRGKADANPTSADEWTLPEQRRAA